MDHRRRPYIGGRERLFKVFNLEFCITIQSNLHADQYSNIMCSDLAPPPHYTSNALIFTDLLHCANKRPVGIRGFCVGTGKVKRYWNRWLDLNFRINIICFPSDLEFGTLITGRVLNIILRKQFEKLVFSCCETLFS